MIGPAAFARRNVVIFVTFAILSLIILYNLQYAEIPPISNVGGKFNTSPKSSDAPEKVDCPEVAPVTRYNSTTISRLHYLIPSSIVKPALCAVVTSALANRYSIPTILGYKGEGEFDANKAHIAKLRAIRRYLHSAAAADDEDLAIIVDGFDVLAQVPAETMIQRYFEFRNRGDQKLANQRGISIEELHAQGVRQTILWGTDKGCFPGPKEDPRCWMVPFSDLPRFKWGPKTENGELPFSESRFLNSGTVIGPVGDLRRFMDAVLVYIDKNWDPDFHFHNSDQYYISTLYARQEYQRMVDLNGGEFPGKLEGDQRLPEPKAGEDDETEFHLFLDMEGHFTQTQCHNGIFMKKLQYKNHDLTTTINEKFLSENEHFKPYKIQMPSSLFRGLVKLYNNLMDTEKPTKTAREWIQSLELGTNIGAEIIYGFYHNTCSKKEFINRHRESWYFPLIKELLRASIRSIKDEQPITSKPIDGRIWMVSEPYPINTRDEFGGVFTDFEKEPFIPLQEFCQEDPKIVGLEYKNKPPVASAVSSAEPEATDKAEEKEEKKGEKAPEGDKSGDKKKE